MKKQSSPPHSDTRQWVIHQTLPAPIETLSEPELLKQIGCGDSEEEAAALLELHHRHYQDVYRFVRSKVSDIYTAEDLTQEVWEVTIVKIRAYKECGGTIKSWLIGIAKNKIRNYFSRQHYELSLNEELSNEVVLTCSSDDSNQFSEKDLQVRQAIEKLPPKQRRAIILKYYGETLESETIKGETKGSVRTNLSRAYDKLEERLAYLVRFKT